MSKGDVRRRFNNAGLWAEVQVGTVQAVVKRSKPAPWRAWQPRGTLSQYVIYLKGGVHVAGVHQYLRPDGILGGSGLPDPKWVLDGGVRYRVAP